MRVLALDTTTRAGSVAIVDDGRVLIEREGDPTRTHAQRLPAELLEALAAVNAATADIDLFAVASGPGSFTGLRIGIATIQGLAFVHRRRVAAVSALRALGEAAAAGLPTGVRVAAWMDAHRHDVFSALYEVGAPSDTGVATLVELEGPAVGPPATALERWSESGLPTAICGDGAILYRALLPSSIAGVAPPPIAAIVARLALIAAREGTTVAPGGVQPLYVRRPDADVPRDAARLTR